MAESKQYFRDEVQFLGRFKSQVFKSIALSFAAYRKFVFFLLGLGFVARIMLLGLTNILGLWADATCFDLGLCHGKKEYFFKFLQDWGSHEFLICLTLVTIVGFILNTYFRVMISRIGSRSVSLFYDEVTLRTSRLPMGFFDTTPVGRIMSRFSSDYGSMFRMAGGPLGEFLCLVFDVIAIVLLMVLTSIWFLPFVIFVVLVQYGIYRHNNPILRESRRQLSSIRGPAMSHMAETAQGARVIRVYDRMDVFIGQFRILQDGVAAKKLELNLASIRYSLQMSLATALNLGVLGVMGGILHRQGLLSVGQIGVGLTYVMMTSNTFQQFFEWLANLEDALTGAERMDEYLRKDIEPGSFLPSSTRFHLQQPIARESNDHTFEKNPDRIVGLGVEVLNLSLQYAVDGPYALKDVSFSIRPGEHIGIVGRTGSGKSSLIQCLYLMYPFASGVISIGNFVPDFLPKDEKKANWSGKQPITLRQFRSLISLIPQDPILFRGTIRENLILDGDLEDDVLWHHLESVKMQDKIMALSGKNAKEALQFSVLERGANLSSGERQLICLCRAVMQNRPIIILDEATSQIDPHFESVLGDCLEGVLNNRTRIVVAHRLSTIETCDRVLTFDAGRLI
jgi:ATP-binding cassette, subfamily B, multidrug efflux pump